MSLELPRGGTVRAIGNWSFCLVLIVTFISALLAPAAVLGDNEDCDDLIVSIPPTIFPDDPRPEVWVANGAIRAIAQTNGVIYLGGDFTELTNASGTSTKARNHLAAIWAANGLPTPWNPNVDGPVEALAISPLGDKVYVGGDFANIGGQQRNRIAAVSRATGVPTDWNPDANGTVHDLLAVGGLVYAAGEFTQIGGVSRNRIAALDAAANSNNATPWNPNADGTVRTIFLQNTTLFVGGDFTMIGGKDRKRLAALNVSVDTGMVKSWNPASNGPVRALAVVGNKVFAGGDFTGIGSENRNYIAAINTPNDGVWPWNPGANGPVTSLALTDTGTILVGGAFTTIGGTYRNHLAELDMTKKCHNTTNWNPSADNTVLALSRSGIALSAGGEFDAVNSDPRSAYALFGTNSSQGGGGPLGSGFWSQEPTWNPPIVPNNNLSATFDVDIRGNGHHVILDIDASINSLNLVEDGGVDVTQGDLKITAAPGIQNLGHLKVGDGKNLYAGVNITIWGIGPLFLDGPGAKLGKWELGSGLETAVPQPIIVNAVEHTVEGSGLIEGKFDNQGAVIANVAEEAIVFNAPITSLGLAQGTESPWQMTNSGEIKAVDGGTIELAGVALEGPGTVLVDDGTLRLKSQGYESKLTTSNLEVKNEGVIEANDDSELQVDGPFTLRSSGKYQGADGSTASISAESMLITIGSPGGEFHLGGGMTGSIGGNLIMTGCGVGSVLGCTPPVLGVGGPIGLASLSELTPTLTIGGKLSLQGIVDVEVGNTGTVYLAGDFENLAVDPSLFNWVNGTLVLNGAVQSFELAGTNLGPRNPDGFVDNFAMGTLDIQPSVVVDFINIFDNVPGEGCEVLYVDNLHLGSGSAIHLYGCRIYYNTLTNDGATIDLGGGALMSTNAGDLNGDLAADLIDVDIFTQVLLGLDTDPQHVAAADLNGDGLIDATDIAFMVEILSAY